MFDKLTLHIVHQMYIIIRNLSGAKLPNSRYVKPTVQINFISVDRFKVK